MNKEQQIKKMSTIIGNVKPFYVETIAEALYNAGYRKVPDGAVILTPEERDEELKACNEKQAELENEIYALKTNYDCLSEHCTDLENKNVAAENMIDSQAKEIERLKADNEALKMWNEAYTQENKKLKIYNDKLCQGIYWKNGEHFSISIEKAKQNSVIEFAKKCKERINADYVNGCLNNHKGHLTEYDIDELIKEFTE